jgi:hypothetical protein
LSGACLPPFHGQIEQTVPQTRTALLAVIARSVDKDLSTLLEADDPISRTDVEQMMMILRKKPALELLMMLLMPLLIISE